MQCSRPRKRSGSRPAMVAMRMPWPVPPRLSGVGRLATASPAAAMTSISVPWAATMRSRKGGKDEAKPNASEGDDADGDKSSSPAKPLANAKGKAKAKAKKWDRDTVIAAKIRGEQTAMLQMGSRDPGPIEGVPGSTRRGSCEGISVCRGDQD